MKIKSSTDESVRCFSLSLSLVETRTNEGSIERLLDTLKNRGSIELDPIGLSIRTGDNRSGINYLIG